MLPILRSATAAPSAEALRMQIRLPNCRPACSRLAPPSLLAGRAASGGLRRTSSSPASTKLRLRRRNCWLPLSCRCAPKNSTHFFHEFARRHGDYAIVGLAAQADRQGRAVRRSSPWFLCRRRSPAAGRRLPANWSMSPLRLTVLSEASSALGEELDPLEDQQATPAMRRHLAKVLLARCVSSLLDRPDLRAGASA